MTAPLPAPTRPARAVVPHDVLVVLDCDGVLVDSDVISLAVQAERISRLGLPTSYEDCVERYLGLGMRATVEDLEARIGRPLPEGWLDELADAVNARFRTDLRPVRGIAAALDALPFATCVASSGSHAKLRLTLGLTGLWSRFEGRIFSGEDVPRGKPAPDLFLHAAHAMGVRPDRCVVVEDSPAGVAAAGAAGMRVVGYCERTPRRRLQDADLVVDDMARLPQAVRTLVG